MKTSRRHFIQASALGSLAMANSVLALPSAESQGNVALSEHLDPFSIAGEHIIEKVLPGPTYFEGMLLGNGDVGVCVVVRPDALVIHISKTDCWDIRVTEGSEKAVK